MVPIEFLEFLWFPVAPRVLLVPCGSFSSLSSSGQVRFAMTLSSSGSLSFIGSLSASGSLWFLEFLWFRVVP